MKSRFSNLTKLHVSPYYRGCVIWNQLPDNVQKAESVEMFKKQVKEHNYKVDVVHIMHITR